MAKLKRLLAPKHWRIARKKFKWTVSPSHGPHSKFECIPLQIIVRDILQLAETGKEAKNIIKKGEVLVDGISRKDHAYPVGLFDVVSVPKIKETYRVVPTSHGLDLLKIDEKEANLKICRINNKKTLKGVKTQLNLNDGKNLLVDVDKYKRGDSLLIEIPNLKIVEHMLMEKGCTGIIVKGKNSGMMCAIDKVYEGGFKKQAKVLCKVDKEKVEILRDYLFVVGKDKPLITVS